MTQPIHQSTEAEKKAALTDLATRFNIIRRERQHAVSLAIPAMDNLVKVMARHTGQSYTVRNLLYSLWNGHPSSLLEITGLDWDIRTDLIRVILAFGFESKTGSFFYDAIKEPITEAGLLPWFLEAAVESTD